MHRNVRRRNRRSRRVPIPGAPKPHDRVIVGAGMSGLAYAWWCAARGEDVLVLEGADRVGGVIRSDQRDGYRIERAATSVPSQLPCSSKT